MCIEYEPSANKDIYGNSMDFFTWSDELYPPDSHNSMLLTVGLKWSNGTGTSDTVL